MSHRNALAGLVVARALVGAHDGDLRERHRRPWLLRLRALLHGRRRGDDGRVVFLAEHYVPDVSAERADALARRLEEAAAGARREGCEIRFLGFAFLPDDDTLLSLVAASCPEEAASTVARADVAADRIAPALWRTGHAG